MLTKVRCMQILFYFFTEYRHGLYLYRHLIRIISESGNRAIAPDLIGFGKSDKPRENRVAFLSVTC